MVDDDLYDGGNDDADGKTWAGHSPDYRTFRTSQNNEHALICLLCYISAHTITATFCFCSSFSWMKILDGRDSNDGHLSPAATARPAIAPKPMPYFQAEFTHNAPVKRRIPKG